jgi:hypothetical protein
MSLVVYRFEVPVDGKWHRHWVNGSILHVASRRPDIVEFWAQHSTTADLYSREFIVVGTGQELPDVAGWLHAGSCLSGPYVWHLIQRRPQGEVPYMRQGAPAVEVVKQVQLDYVSKGDSSDG